MIRALLVATYVLAAATVGIAVALPYGLPIGLITGVVLAIAGAQIHASFNRRREKRVAEREIAGLKRVTFQFEQALSETRAQMDDMNRAIEMKANERNKKLVSELQMIETLMRDFATKMASNARRATVTPVPASPAAHMAAHNTADLLETIRDCLASSRVDLYLQPIVSLPQRKLRYYEALSRLRSADGKVIMPEQYIQVASPAGLMSVVDNLLLFRCVQIVRRLTQKNRDIGIFCNISGDTLADTEFFPQFLEYLHHNRDLAGHIVFEFSQAAIAKAGAQGEANLTYLSQLGFGLSMDHVSTLAVDLAKLRMMGFRHLKVRAATLTHGMGGSGALVSAEDLKKLLERHGLSLIAERVEDERTVVQLLDFGVDFGQGYLFGEPRAVREDSLKGLEKPDMPSASTIPLRKIA